jgi:hypothetical protein
MSSVQEVEVEEVKRTIKTINCRQFTAGKDTGYRIVSGIFQLR